MKKQIVFIIPGFLGVPSEKIYQQVSASYKNKEIEPIILDISWKRKTMSEYVDYFLSVYKQYAGNEIHLFGWSFGAMIALITASRVPVETLVLCSISPYWQEDMNKLLKSWIAGVGKRRVVEFATLSRKDISMKVNAKKVVMLVGVKEGSIMINVTQSIAKDVNAQNIVIIQGVGHNIAKERYAEVIKQQIANL